MNVNVVSRTSNVFDQAHHQRNGERALTCWRIDSRPFLNPISELIPASVLSEGLETTGSFVDKYGRIKCTVL